MAILLLVLLLLAAATSTVSTAAFAPHQQQHRQGNKMSSSSAFLGRRMTLLPPPPPPSRGGQRSGSSRRGGRGGSGGMTMFLGQDSGILGVGAPEIAVIVLVGYFILGPTELYKLTKSIGKTIQNFRSLSTEATKSFESTMENQLELDELRKAQQELNDAFSFRRSINTDEGEDFNEVGGRGSVGADADSLAAEVADSSGAAAAAATASATATATAETTAPKKKKKVKRRKVKKTAVPSPDVADDVVGDVPDLDMSAAFGNEAEAANGNTEQEGQGGDTTLREERMARLQAASQSESTGTRPDWFDDRDLDELAMQEEDGSSSSNAASPFADAWGAESAAEQQERFSSQLSDEWNESILANEDELAPLAKIMDRLAILEEEKKAATLRLEEEFRMRGELEEEFYRKKKELLEQSAAEVQADAYVKVANKAGGAGETTSATTPTNNTQPS
mmetsp:Transcript_10474/g.22186  ORF Transcript_10474/g.22186 Transcript_10474/m.22186 type:complete len:449 (-) Transcript_10474:141-1487(-)